MSVPPIHNRCCVPTLDGHYNCPKGHCSTKGGCCSSSPWKIAIISFLISDILWFLLSSSSPFALLLVATPTHSPGLDYSNYWTEKEVSTGVHNGRVSSGRCYKCVFLENDVVCFAPLSSCTHHMFVVCLLFVVCCLFLCF